MKSIIKYTIVAIFLIPGQFSYGIVAFAQEDGTYYYGSGSDAVTATDNSGSYYYGSGSTNVSPVISNSESYYYGSNGSAPVISNTDSYYYGSSASTPVLSDTSTYYYGSTPTVSNTESYYYGSTGNTSDNSGSYYYGSGSTPTISNTDSGSYYYGSTPNISDTNSGSYYYGSTGGVTTDNSGSYYYGSTPTTYGSYGTGYSNSYLSIGATNYGTSYYQAPIITQTGGTVIGNQVINNPTPVNNRCSYTQDSYTSSYTNNYPTCTKVCTNGATVAGNTSCPAPVINNIVYCANGTLATYGCSTPNPTPVYPTPVINYTGSSYYQAPVVAQSSYYQQYQVQSPVSTDVIAPMVIKFNNVVTSLPTQITKTSARCNGIGLIAQGAQSTGWFEYGQTANLGRVTATAAIGSAASAPFSNVLAGLQSNTTYYCRAVMQNQYGTVKGEVVKFTTKGTVVHYVAPAVKKTVTKTVTKAVVKTNIVTCSDGSSFTVNSSTAAATINNGQKLVTLSLEKTDGDLVASGNVSYRLVYKNLSDVQLHDVTLKVTIPGEIAVQNVSGGSYDNDTHQLTLNLGTLNPYQEGVLSWSGKVVQNVREGQSVVSTGYLGYTVTNAQGQSVQDEVTAYVVGSISSVISTAAGAQHVIGADGSRSFLPGSLVEWLALIAILFIIFILGRSVAASYKSEKDAHH